MVTINIIGTVLSSAVVKQHWWRHIYRVQHFYVNPGVIIQCQYIVEHKSSEKKESHWSARVLMYNKLLRTNDSTSFELGRYSKVICQISTSCLTQQKFDILFFKLKICLLDGGFLSCAVVVYGHSVDLDSFFLSSICKMKLKQGVIFLDLRQLWHSLGNCCPVIISLVE